MQSQARESVGDRPQQDLWDGAGQSAAHPGASPTHMPGPTAPSNRTLSRPMWMRRLVRKALGLKEDELKAFFIKASAREKQRGAGDSCGKGVAIGQRHAVPPGPQSWVLPLPQSGGGSWTQVPVSGDS